MEAQSDLKYLQTLSPSKAKLPCHANATPNPQPSLSLSSLLKSIFFEHILSITSGVNTARTLITGGGEREPNHDNENLKNMIKDRLDMLRTNRRLRRIEKQFYDRGSYEKKSDYYEECVDVMKFQRTDAGHPIHIRIRAWNIILSLLQSNRVQELIRVICEDHNHSQIETQVFFRQLILSKFSNWLIHPALTISTHISPREDDNEAESVLLNESSPIKNVNLKFGGKELRRGFYSLILGILSQHKSNPLLFNSFNPRLFFMSKSASSVPSNPDPSSPSKSKPASQSSSSQICTSTSSFFDLHSILLLCSEMELTNSSDYHYHHLLSEYEGDESGLERSVLGNSSGSSKFIEVVPTPTSLFLFAVPKIHPSIIHHLRSSIIQLQTRRSPTPSSSRFHHHHSLQEDDNEGLARIQIIFKYLTSSFSQSVQSEIQQMLQISLSSKCGVRRIGQRDIIFHSPSLLYLLCSFSQTLQSSHRRIFNPEDIVKIINAAESLLQVRSCALPRFGPRYEDGTRLGGCNGLTVNGDNGIRLWRSMWNSESSVRYATSVLCLVFVAVWCSKQLSSSLSSNSSRNNSKTFRNSFNIAQRSTIRHSLSSILQSLSLGLYHHDSDAVDVDVEFGTTKEDGGDIRSKGTTISAKMEKEQFRDIFCGMKSWNRKKLCSDLIAFLDSIYTCQHSPVYDGLDTKDENSIPISHYTKCNHGILRHVFDEPDSVDDTPRDDDELYTRKLS